MILFCLFVKILLAFKKCIVFGGVGEVVNTLVCGTSIRGFDSHTPPHCVYKVPFWYFFLYHKPYNILRFINQLFDIIDRNIFETTFLESVKCYPLERKNLKTCSSNCKNIMLEQLKILNPKLIITLGEFPTRNLLDFKFNKFADVVGKIYEVNDYKILPIYHPSPISPKSYTGNIPLFEKLRDM